MRRSLEGESEDVRWCEEGISGRCEEVIRGG